MPSASTTLYVSVTSHHTHAFRPDAACADLSVVCVPSSPHNIAFRPNTVGECYLPSHPCLPSRRCLCRPSVRCVPSHHHTTLPSVPILSVSVTSHHTHAFRPDAACADLPSFAFHHDNKAMPSRFRPNTVGECHLPSHPCLPSRRCLCRPSVLCVPSSPHLIAFRPNTVGECRLQSHSCLPPPQHCM